MKRIEWRGNKLNVVTAQHAVQRPQILGRPFALNGGADLIVWFDQHRGGRGYPGDTKQVSKGDLRNIRKLCKLTSSNGVDSQSFYHGVDDMTSLLSEYQQNLRRLADR